MKASKHTVTVTFWSYDHDGQDITEIESVEIDGAPVNLTEEATRLLDDAIFRMEEKQ